MLHHLSNHTDNNKQRVFAEHLNTLFMLSPSLCIAQCLLASFAILGLSNSIEKTVLFFVWLALIASVMLDTFIFVLYKNNAQPKTRSRAWYYAFCAGKGALAVVWGIVTVILMQRVPLVEHWFIILFIMLSVSLSAANLLSSRLALSLSLTGMLLPVLLHLTLNNGHRLSWFALILLVMSCAYVLARHWFELGRSAQAIRDHLDNAALKHALSQSEKHIKLLKQQVMDVDTIDSVTQLPNRHYFEQAWENQSILSQQNNEPLSLLLIDIDDLKVLNQQYGYDMGNRCLALTAQCLKGGLRRAADFVAHYEDDTFAVVLPNTPCQGAQVVAESLRESLYVLSQDWEGLRSVTVSIGVAGLPREWDCELEQLQQLPQYAQRALTLAKQAGQNCVRYIELDAEYNADMTTV